MSLIPGSSSAPSIHPNGIASGSVATPTPLLIPYGITGQIGNVRASSSTAQTLVNSDNDIQIFNPTAAHDVNLPTTSVAAGRAFYIVNRGGYALTIKSSGGNTVVSPSTGTVTNGVYLVRALQAAPTTAAHWQVEYVYEVGTFTPTDQSGASLSFSAGTAGFYTKIGRDVHVWAQIIFPATASGAAATISLPFTSANVSNSYCTGATYTNQGSEFVAYLPPNFSSFLLRDNTDTGKTNANLSSKFLVVNFTYSV